ncbi:nucleoporin Nup35 [Schistocerca gregaria]|uniref:nucleoporin Nup35 n=1 Tax=Schistocerca gregaria TaxID=7010 RepID=UPI00211EF767|nr:nucleoporin Nup35 [Schistocerca gregaria]
MDMSAPAHKNDDSPSFATGYAMDSEMFPHPTLSPLAHPPISSTMPAACRSPCPSSPPTISMYQSLPPMSESIKGSGIHQPLSYADWNAPSGPSHFSHVPPLHTGETEPGYSPIYAHSSQPPQGPVGWPVVSDTSEAEADLSGHWVTVFGFPPSHTSIILAYFQCCGQIVRFKNSENQGNWIHILFQTRLQAEKALGKNGKILDSGNLMIGVLPISDRDLKALVDEQDQKIIGKGKTASAYAPMASEYAVETVDSKPTQKSSYWNRFMELIVGY